MWRKGTSSKLLLKGGRYCVVVRRRGAAKEGSGGPARMAAAAVAEGVCISFGAPASDKGGAKERKVWRVSVCVW